MVSVRSQRAIKVLILAGVSSIPLFFLRPFEVLADGFVYGILGFTLFLLHELGGIGALGRFVRFAASRSWYNAVPAKSWHPKTDSTLSFTVKVLASLSVLSVWFLASMLLLSIFFFSVGVPFNNPRILLLACFLGTVVIRLSRYGLIEQSDESIGFLTGFLVEFGVIIGIFLVIFGPVTVYDFMRSVSAQIDSIFAVFVLLFLSDAFFQTIHDRANARQSKLPV